MQLQKQKLLAEKQELDEKLDRLNSFMLTASFTQLAPAERDRMSRQAAAMVDYSAVLAERIAAFKP